jgi:DNA-binding MarR family transcriptional regulator
VSPLSTPSTIPRSDRTVAQSNAYLEILRAAEQLERGFSDLFKVHDLSATQYNVLRILRGAGTEGHTCGDVSARLVTHDPDVTRLLDRLEKRGLIERRRSDKDRRVVRTTISDGGMALLQELDGPVDALHESQFGHMSEDNLRLLTTLLEEARKKDA